MTMSTTGSVVPINQLLSQPSPADQMPGTQSSSSSGGALGANDFLTLLTTEMQNQDPTQPQDPTQSVTQLAQFSELQYQQQMTSAFAAFQSNFAVLQSTSLVGKQVTVENTGANGSTSTTTGTVSSIDVQNGVPFFTMTGSNGQTITDGNGNPLLFQLSQIVGVGAAPASGSGSGSGSGGSSNGGSTGGGG
jgi:flagellar basal-body rod modification protein FlgD